MALQEFAAANIDMGGESDRKRSKKPDSQATLDSERILLSPASSDFSTAEKWMREGKLNNVAPGEPTVNERDLKSFLHRQ